MDVKIQREVSVNEDIYVRNNKDVFFVTLGRVLKAVRGSGGK